MDLIGDVGMWILVLVRLETVSVLVQDRCTFAPNVPWAQKSFWTHPMVRQGDAAQDRCMVCAERTIGSESFCTQPMELLGAWVMWNLVSVYLEIVLASVQDRCTVCAKRTIGLEIILEAPDGTPR
jgi:hypothetical protein